MMSKRMKKAYRDDWSFVVVPNTTAEPQLVMRFGFAITYFDGERYQTMRQWCADNLATDVWHGEQYCGTQTRWAFKNDRDAVWFMLRWS